MNIAAPNTTTTTTSAAAAASSASTTTASSNNNNIKRWTMANAAASYLHFTTRPSSSSSSSSAGSPPPPPLLGQHFSNQVNKKNRQGGGHKSHHHHHVGSKTLSSSSSSSRLVSKNTNNGTTVCRSSWKESDFTLDGLLGEGHFGKIYRAYCCYPPRSSFTTTASSTNPTTTAGSGGRNTNNNNIGLPTDNTTCPTILPNNNTVVALKRFSRGRIADAQNRGSRFVELLQREINIHSNLQHPCIISFLGHYADQNHLTLVLEYAGFGDLYGYMALLTEQQQHQPEGGISRIAMRIDTARTVMSQMTAAVAHLQQLFIAHRDIKSENILLVEAVVPAVSPSPFSSSGAAAATSGTTRRTMPVPTVFKLCDFGWAVSYQGFISGRLSTLCGTPEYVPPEMLGPNRFYRGEFVDPWALGVLAYELVVGYTPFYVDDQNEKCYGVTGSGGSIHGQQDELIATSNTTAIGSSSSRKKKNTVDGIFDNIRNFRELELPFVEVVDEDYVDLVQGFLQVEPMHRRLARDCLNHAFFQKGPSNHRRGGSSGAGQKENIMEKSYHDSTTPPPTVSQRCELWNKQKQFWQGSEQEI